MATAHIARHPNRDPEVKLGEEQCIVDAAAHSRGDHVDGRISWVLLNAVSLGPGQARSVTTSSPHGWKWLSVRVLYYQMAVVRSRQPVAVLLGTQLARFFCGRWRHRSRWLIGTGGLYCCGHFVSWCTCRRRSWQYRVAGRSRNQLLQGQQGLRARGGPRSSAPGDHDCRHAGQERRIDGSANRLAAASARRAGKAASGAGRRAIIPVAQAIAFRAPSGDKPPP